MLDRLNGAVFSLIWPHLCGVHHFEKDILQQQQFHYFQTRIFYRPTSSIWQNMLKLRVSVAEAYECISTNQTVKFVHTRPFVKWPLHLLIMVFDSLSISFLCNFGLLLFSPVCHSTSTSDSCICSFCLMFHDVALRCINISTLQSRI